MCLNLLVKDFGGYEMNIKKYKHNVSEVTFLLMSKKTHSLELYNRAQKSNSVESFREPLPHLANRLQPIWK